MNGGIHDAWNLAERLIAIHRGADIDLQLALYDRQRRQICISFIQEQTRNNKRQMESRDPDQQRRRQAELMRTAADPLLAREFLLRSSMINSLRDAAKTS